MLGQADTSADRRSRRGGGRVLRSAPPSTVSITPPLLRLTDRQLFDAVRDNSLLRVRQALTANADPNAANRFGETPVFRASWLGQVEIVRALLQGGANPNKTDCKGSTPLSFTSCVRTVKVLLEAGADPNAADCFGNTPLHAASWSSELTVAMVLHQAGADLYARNIHGETPLDRSRVFQQAKVVRFFLQQYVQATLANTHDGDEGSTALHAVLEEAIYMSDRRHSGRIKLTIGTVSVQQLVSVLQDIDEQDPTAIQTRSDAAELPFHVATRLQAPVEVLYFLLRLYPDVLVW